MSDESGACVGTCICGRAGQPQCPTLGEVAGFDFDHMRVAALIGEREHGGAARRKAVAIGDVLFDAVARQIDLERSCIDADGSRDCYRLRLAAARSGIGQRHRDATGDQIRAAAQQDYPEHVRRGVESGSIDGFAEVGTAEARNRATIRTRVARSIASRIRSAAASRSAGTRAGPTGPSGPASSRTPRTPRTPRTSPAASPACGTRVPGLAAGTVLVVVVTAPGRCHRCHCRRNDAQDCELCSHGAPVPLLM